MNESADPTVTVVIVVKNGMPDIARCLKGVSSQVAPWPFEVLVIDSGSRDGTLDVVRKSGARLIEIAPQAFNHGDTRNLGAQEARGTYIVFLVADAIPFDHNWLAPLVKAVQEDRVAGAYSRQLPRPEHDLLIRASVEAWHTGGTQRLVKEYPQDGAGMLTPEQRYSLAIFDDVSSCMRKEVWRSFPYANVHCEDVEWSNRVLAAGYRIVFEPSSVVYHSHRRSTVSNLKRAYVYNRQLYRIFGLDPVPRFPDATRAWLSQIRRRSALVFRGRMSIGEKAGLWLKIPAFSAPVFGQYMGIRSDGWLPRHRWFKRVDRWFTEGTQ